MTAQLSALVLNKIVFHEPLHEAECIHCGLPHMV